MITSTPRWKDDKKAYLKNYFEKYYEQNKEKILTQQTEYVKKKKKPYCSICDSYVSRLSLHNKTQKHLENSK